MQTINLDNPAFGTWGGGVTGDDDALAAAIAYAGTTPSIIHMPRPIYLFAAQPVIPATSKLHLVGKGSYKQARTVLQRAFDGNFIVLNDQEPLRMTSIELYGNKAEFTTGNGIDAFSTPIFLTNSSVRDFNGKGIRLQDGWYSQLQDVNCSANTLDGLHVDGRGNAVGIIGGQYSSNGRHGLNFDGANGGCYGFSVLGATTAELNGNTGLNINGGSAFDVSGFYSEANVIALSVSGVIGTGKISGSYLQGTSPNQIVYLSQTGIVTIEGSHIYSTAVAPTAYGIRTLAPTAKVISRGNVFTNVTYEVGDTGGGELSVGNKMSLGFYRDNVAANLVADPIARGSGAVNDYAMVFAGVVRGVAIRASAAANLGTLTVAVYKNGVAIGVSPVFTSAHGTYRTYQVPHSAVTFVAGDRISVAISTTADWDVTTMDIAVDVVVETNI